MPEIKLEVGMTCEGCAGAVKRILGKLQGVSNVETHVDEKLVIVTTAAEENITGDQLVEQLSKWSAASGKYVKVA